MKRRWGRLKLRWCKYKERDIENLRYKIMMNIREKVEEGQKKESLIIIISNIEIMSSTLNSVGKDAVGSS